MHTKDQAKELDKFEGSFETPMHNGVTTKKPTTLNRKKMKHQNS